MRHGKRKQLELSDIQDEDDIYDRIVIRQKQRAKKPKKLADPYDEQGEIINLHEKVQAIEGRAPKLPKVEAIADNSREDLPVLVESAELANERLLLSIPNLSDKCHYLLDNYEKLELHLLFVNQETNGDFRRFLALLAENPTQDTGILGIRKDLFTKVLKDSIAKVEAKKQIQKRFERYRTNLEEEDEEQETNAKGVRRTVKKIKVPDIVLQLLDL